MIRNVIKANWPYVFIIFLFSLIPLLWYGNGGLVFGHDAGWSLNPTERFISRLYAWTTTGFGYDQSIDVGTLTIYALPALLSSLSLPIIFVQKLTYIFWFMAMGISMYICVVVLFKMQHARLIALAAAFFYTVNHYTLQAWTVAELSKFSVMVLFPIALTLIWCVLDKRIKLRHALLSFIFVSFFFNGGGASGIPLYAGMLLTLCILFLYKLLIERKNVFHIALTYISFLIAFILINFYWLGPLVQVIFSQYSPFATSGGPQSVIAWTNVISANTSFINLFRLQGFSGWYDEPTHPYAYIFLTNPLFIIASFVAPLLACSALLFTRKKNEKKLITFFLFVLLFSMLFTAGTHTPFGFIYSWLIKNVFGFAIFRTAFYKFGYALWFSYAILVSYSVIELSSRFRKKVMIPGVVVFVIFISVYNFPFFTASFFQINQYFTTIVKLPNYIQESGEYIQTLPSNSRILLIPPPSPTNGQSDIYEFGYFSRTPLPYQLTQKSIITNAEINSDSEEKLTERFYTALQKGDENVAKDLLYEMGITHVLIRNDVELNNEEYRVADPVAFKQNLQKFQWITKEKEIGKWEIYKFNPPVLKVAAVPVNINFVSGNFNDFVENYPLTADFINVPLEYSEMLPVGKETIVVECAICDISGISKLPSSSSIKIYPTSPFYFISKLNEERNLKRSVASPYLYFGYLYFYAEKHSIELLRLSEQYLDEDEPRIDQPKRFDIVATYKKTLKNEFNTFKSLSEVEKMTVVREYVKSLEKQRLRLKNVGKSRFFNEIYSQYSAAYSLINTILDSQDVKTSIAYRGEYDVYRFNIAKKGIYKISGTFDNTPETILDGVRVENTDETLLAAGEHRIDVKKSEKAAYEVKEVELSNSHPTYEIELSGLHPDTEYRVEFKYRLQQSPSMSVRVVDDLGKQKVDELVELTPPLSYEPYDTVFRTNNLSNSTYKLIIYAESELGSERNASIRDLIVMTSSAPILFMEGVGGKKQTLAPKISYGYVDPTRARVHIQNAKDPFVLIFKETYSPFWHANIVTGESLDKHFSANGAFNGWYIDKQGDYDIELTFSPQKKYTYGYIISSIVFAVSLLLCGVFLIKKK